MSVKLNIQDVVISEDGRVVITNLEFAKNLVGDIKKLVPGNAGIFDNCDCKGNFLREVNLREILPSKMVEIDLGLVGIFDNCDCKGRVIGPELVARGK